MSTRPKLSIVFLITLWLFSGVACKKENPNPELLDPIYSDLKKEAKNYAKLLKEELVNLEELEKEKELVKPRTVEVVANKKEIQKAKRKILHYKQKAKFFEIRSERRRVESRKSYKIAFKKEEGWPDPKEYENYLVYKRLRNSPSNWNHRVPVLHRNSPNYKEKSEKK